MSEERLTLICENAARCDVYISENAELSRSFLKKLFDAGEIFVNGKAVRASYKLKSGDEISFSLPEAKPLNVIFLITSYIFWIFQDHKNNGFYIYQKNYHRKTDILRLLEF